MRVQAATPETVTAFDRQIGLDRPPVGCLHASPAAYLGRVTGMFLEYSLLLQSIDLTAT
jgi:hypothetical protein